MAASSFVGIAVLSRLPVLLGLSALVLGGVFLLHRADQQGRDTIRKHQLQDLEDSLYLARSRHGTYPPYGESAWCGLLNDPANAAVRAEIETALRQRVEKYANPNKPFPVDPLLQPDNDYFYWKRSPAVFEIYSRLEADPNGTRNTSGCPAAPALRYDYGINSALRDGA